MSVIKSSIEQKILVIDDTKTDRELFRAILGRAGYRVEVAENGEEALRKLGAEEFDLVCCDYMMPVMDGYGFLKSVREKANLKHLIVIIVTSDESEETKIRLLRAGANDFIHKGASHEEIKARVQTHLAATQTTAARAAVQLAGRLANEINQPLSAMTAALDLLKESIEGGGTKKQLLPVVDTLNRQVDRMTELTQGIRRLGMDPEKHYRSDKS